jgi:hypothetical protein
MEWVQDRYDRNYYDNSPLEDPEGPNVGLSRVNKGGNWYASPADGRCAFRGFSGPEMNFWNLGFRVVMEEKEEFTLASKGRNRSRDSETKSASPAKMPPGRGDGLQLFRQAMYAAQRQRWDEAVEHLEDALKIYEKREDFHWVARVRATLAGIYAERERKYKAIELFTKALSEFRRIGDKNSERVILLRLLDLVSTPGVKVTDIKKDGEAAKAGVVKVDIIFEYGGEVGFKRAGFKELVNDYARMSQVPISVFNNEEVHTFSVRGGPLGVAVENVKKLRRTRTPPRRGTRERSRSERRGRR